MIERIKTIAASKNITISHLADEILFSRSSLSHIILKRNKPSLDFVTKVLTTYKDINPKWLLFGEGTMYMKDMKKTDEIDIFHPEQDNMKIQILENENKKLKKELKLSSKKEENLQEGLQNLKRSDKNVKIAGEKRILLLFDDHTYEEFTTV